jgi:cell fate regulator YaaT (PSP1 superfamily)
MIACGIDNSDYLVVHGKTGVLGRFNAVGGGCFKRGDRVVVQGDRGTGIGVVLREATDRQKRVLGNTPPGRLLRRVTVDDQIAERRKSGREHDIFQSCRKLALELNLPIEVLDCELSLEGQSVILQYLLASTCDAEPLIARLRAQYGVEVWLENLALPQQMQEEPKLTEGCGEPNCGKAEGGKGCETCSTGGGCTSCGSGGVDVKAYFGHLRTKMEGKLRTPLI